ncbi:MAG TPA: hypothetical protein GX745_05100, partial [Clostridiales bacterium]|nr:hypothetical protein [Clostridiales bacterium]
GSMYNFNGLQGLIWDYDKDGNTYFTEFGRKCADDPTTLLNGKIWKSPWSGKTYELSSNFNDGKLQINNTTWARDVVNPDSNGETYNDKSWKLERGEPRCDVEAAWREWAESTTEEEYMRKRENYTVCPAINYSESVRDDELELVWTKVSAKLKELTWKAMYAEHEGEFNYLVSKMIADCKDLGYDQCKEWSENEAAIKWRMQQELYPDKYGSPSG